MQEALSLESDRELFNQQSPRKAVNSLPLRYHACDDSLWW